MTLENDLNSEIRKILKEPWTTREGKVVPEPEDLMLRNDAVLIEGTVLYADLDESTNLVDTKEATFAARIYKSYLSCAARIIRAEGGAITAYDGDRIMAVFIGNSKNTDAVSAGLKINFAVQEVINPAIREEIPGAGYAVKQKVGIDTSNLYVVHEGIRGDNDLVWVGRAANHAARLCSRPGAPTQITADVHDRLHESVRVAPNSQHIWTQEVAWDIGGRTVYTTTWWRRV